RRRGTAAGYARTLDIPVADHCEEPSLSAGGVMHEGLIATKLGLKGIPAAAEEIMVARDILLAELTGGRVHLCHLSTRGSVELMRRAKERGLRVTAEVTPHHLRLTRALPPPSSRSTWRPAGPWTPPASTRRAATRRSPGDRSRDARP